MVEVVAVEERVAAMVAVVCVVADKRFAVAAVDVSAPSVSCFC